MPRQLKELTTSTAYGVTVLSDGDQTEAEVNVKFSPFSSLHVMGRGVSKRRKGDTRDRDLGELLALRRSFLDAAANILRELEARGFATEEL